MNTDSNCLEKKQSDFYSCLVCIQILVAVISRLNSHKLVYVQVFMYFSVLRIKGLFIYY